jgi:hypothetical protein
VGRWCQAGPSRRMLLQQGAGLGSCAR